MENCKNMFDFLPQPIIDEHPEYLELYRKAWELVKAHIKEIDGMPQTPYMDEGFCETQIWIWDTCFMSLFCKYAQDYFPGKESFRNFYDVLYGGKRLPKIITPEDEPDWVGAVPGEEFEIQIDIADNPPLFAWAEYENALIHGDKEYVKKILYDEGYLQKHFYWLENLKERYEDERLHSPTYWIACEKGYKWGGGCSGMDNTPRGREGSYVQKGRPDNPEMLWIDAICQQALSAKCISRLFRIIEDDENAAKWEGIFCEKQKLINENYWDFEDEFYYDIDCRDNSFYKVKTVASYWTMTAGAATEEAAKKLSEYAFDEKLFGGTVPLVSLARNDGNFEENGKYWRGSLWLPTAYAALKGFYEYGMYEQAHLLAEKIVSHMAKTYKEYEPHTIWECYSPSSPAPGAQTDGKTVVRKDFCGWSALGPISVFIEFYLGFHTVDAFKNEVRWSVPKDIDGRVGIQNLRFGKITADIVADGKKLTVKSSGAFTLFADGKKFDINAGMQEFAL